MRFNDTFFYASVVCSIKNWSGLPVYVLVLGCPAIVAWLAVAIVISFICDIIVSCREIIKVAA